MQRELMVAHSDSSLPHTQHSSQGPDPPGLPCLVASASPRRGGLGPVSILGQAPGREGKPASLTALGRKSWEVCPLAEKYFPDVF